MEFQGGEIDSFNGTEPLVSAMKQFSQEMYGLRNE